MADVALVLVSHSAAAAEGIAEIARQMAPDVAIVPAGGTAEGVGTSVARVQSAVEAALAATVDRAGPGGSGGVVVLTDLGSAVLTAEVVLELLGPLDAARVRLPSAPLLEGAVAAAVTAQQGGGVAAVEASAVAAGTQFAVAAAGGAAEDRAADVATGEDVRTATVVVRNPLGLHARPAALVARAVTDSGARITVGGVDGASVLALMALGAVGGDELTVVASGPGAQAALDTVVALVDGGFGEVDETLG